MDDIEHDVVSLLKPIRTSTVRCFTNPIGSHDWREEGRAWNPIVWELEGMPERRPFRRSHISDGSKEELAPVHATQHQQMGAHSRESQELLYESEGLGLIQLDVRGAALGQGYPNMDSCPLISPASAFQPVFMQTRSLINTLRRKTTATIEQQRPHSLHPEERNTLNTIRRKGERSTGSGIWSDEALYAAIEVVDNGTLIAHAATTANIPASSLHDHLFGRTTRRKRGPQTIFTRAEEEELRDYLLKMQRYGHPLSLLQLRLLVARITHIKYTLFKDSIPGRSWIKWFRNRHPDLALRKPQGLERARVSGLCLEAADSFYNNLQDLYNKHNYIATHIWNIDETGIQAGRQGRANVLAKKRSRGVYSVIYDEKERLSVLACVNAARCSIPSFYIFRRLQFYRNYIKDYENGATMAMQQKASMTGFLFFNWLDYFIKHVQTLYGISTTNRHLLIVDGHNSHVTIEVVKKAARAGIDMVSLLSQTSHALQPLDVSFFKPFKTTFRFYMDQNCLQRRGKKVEKEELAS
jgi:hypothetical protein